MIKGPADFFRQRAPRLLGVRSWGEAAAAMHPEETAHTPHLDESLQTSIQSGPSKEKLIERDNSSRGHPHVVLLKHTLNLAL